VPDRTQQWAEYNPPPPVRPPILAYKLASMRDNVAGWEACYSRFVWRFCADFASTRFDLKLAQMIRLYRFFRRAIR